jgi:hypothetical protein
LGAKRNGRRRRGVTIARVILYQHSTALWPFLAYLTVISYLDERGDKFDLFGGKEAQVRGWGFQSMGGPKLDVEFKLFGGLLDISRGE